MDELAFTLVNIESDVDAIERDDLRAEWTEDNESVRVTDLETGDERVYTADDLVLATSDQEVSNAREPRAD